MKGWQVTLLCVVVAVVTALSCRAWMDRASRTWQADKKRLTAYADSVNRYADQERKGAVASELAARQSAYDAQAARIKNGLLSAQLDSARKARLTSKPPVGTASDSAAYWHQRADQAEQSETGYRDALTVERAAGDALQAASDSQHVAFGRLSAAFDSVRTVNDSLEALTKRAPVGQCRVWKVPCPRIGAGVVLTTQGEVRLALAAIVPFF